MSNFQLSVVHRLPQFYQWSQGLVGFKAEPLPASTSMSKTGDKLICLQLLSHKGEEAQAIMDRLSQYLRDILVECAVIECEHEPCLFVNSGDEGVAVCHLKNVGVAIAEKPSDTHPF